MHADRAARAALEPFQILKTARPLLILLCAAGSGCGGDSADLAPARLIHAPPVGQLNPQQLRSLSMECEKYAPNGSMRGRYDAAYCDEAMAAWSDSPLQMVPVQKEAPADASGAPRQ
jgi:hypothetical protein